MKEVIKNMLRFIKVHNPEIGYEFEKKLKMTKEENDETEDKADKPEDAAEGSEDESEEKEE